MKIEEKDSNELHFIRVIGEGAFSRVYLAEGRDGQRFACKVSRKVIMLEREADILDRLYHPLFPTYMGYEERAGAGYLFMEYIPGRSLGQLARIRGGISWRQAMRIAEELAAGMRYLHERQPAVLYRDLKPENIMVCEDGHVKVVDFGCACHQDGQEEAKVGTPGFAPPEQLSLGGVAGIYSDVYALGRTMESVMAERKTSCGRARLRHGGKSKEHTEEGKRCGERKRLHTEEGKRCGERTRRHTEEGKHCGERTRRHTEERKRCREEKICLRRLERMIEESTREDHRQRPQDMVSVLHILTGKRKKEEGIICEKNIWESSHKNSCSLPLI